MWEETREPGENPHMHRVNMQTLHGKAGAKIQTLNLFYCVLTTAPPGLPDTNHQREISDVSVDSREKQMQTNISCWLFCKRDIKMLTYATELRLQFLLHKMHLVHKMKKEILLFYSCISAENNVLRLLMTCNTGFIHKMVQYVHLYTGWPSNAWSGNI